jgi:predicted transcriptional regulator
MARKRNLTVQLDEELVRKARVLAAQRSTSVSRLVAEELEVLVRDDERYEEAMREALTELERGAHLGGGPYAGRDELHER